MNLKKTVEKILEADRAYYSGGHPILSDQEYDALKDYIRSKEPDHPILSKIGDTPSSSWEKTAHEINMGSLNKVHTEDEFRSWAEKYKGQTFVAQPKLDGLSLSLVYKKQDGKVILDRAVTRGNNEEGEVITPNVVRMRGVFTELSLEEDTVLRAEILLPNKDFDRINDILEEDDKYSNSRNAAAGISRALDGHFCEYLWVIPYDVIVSGKDVLNEDKKLELLAELGFKSPGQTTGDIEEMVKAYDHMKTNRDKYPFRIDGMVVKVSSSEVQQKAGHTNNRPRAQIAWKFDPPGAITELKHVSFDVGRTGVVTPLGWVNPVEIDGSIVSKATLHNIAEIQRLQIGIGDTIMLVKAGDIIPKIVEVIEHRNKEIEIPFRCPSCNTILSNNGVQLKCTNEKCPRRNFFRIMNWIKVLNIDGMGESLVDELQGASKLPSIEALYSLRVEDIASLEGWGKSSGEKIIEEVRKSRHTTPEKFLAALGIPGLAEKTARKLLDHFDTIENLLAAQSIESLKGFGDILASKILLGLKTYKDEIESLLKIISFESNTEGTLSGKSFCFTGPASKPRTFFQALVKKHGGTNSSSVTKDLKYLVSAPNWDSSKVQKARKYGVTIISEQEFMSMIGENIHEEESSKKKLEVTKLF